MNEKWLTAGVTVLTGIVGVAVIAILVSRSSNTSGVLGAGSGGFATALCTALSPLGVSCGNGSNPSVNSTITYPGL